MKCQQMIITEYTKEQEGEKEERMRMRRTMRKENKTGTARKAQDRRSQKKSVLSRHTASHSSDNSLIHLSHYITTFPSYSTTSTWLSHSHFIAFDLLVCFTLLPNDFFEQSSSLDPGSCFHSKALVFTLWAHRLKHLHVPEQAHRPSASPRGTVPKGRLGRELVSVSQKLKDTFMLMLWFLLHTMQQWNRAGVGWPICLVAMTMCYPVLNDALSSLAAWLLWADNTLKKM